MNRLLLTAVLLLAFGALTLALLDGAPASADGESAVVLRVGDTMTVEDGEVGCQVILRKGRPTLDCRRAGRLAGTYGTMLDERRARLVRFRSSDTAKVVYTAKHRRAARRCGKARRARR